MNEAGMTIIYRVDLDAPQNVIWIGTLLVQGDDSAHKIVVELYRGREKHLPADGVTALGVFVRSDGYAVALGGDIAGNTVSITLDGACYAVAGPCYLSMVLNDQGGERTVLKAAGRVDQDENNGYIDETVYTSFDALVEAAVNAYLGGTIPGGGGGGITGPYVSSVNGQSGAVTLKTGDLENNSGFITKTVSDLTNYYLKSETYTREEINQRISQIPKFAISVVSTLPATGDVNTIYLVGGGISGNLYTEYIWANGAWEILGSQRVDLTGYATETWVSGQLGSYLKASELEGAINTALAHAAASGEFDGADGVGVAGVSVAREPDEYGYYYITVELTDGQQEVIPYKNGADGNGIESAVLNADYTLTLNFTNGTSYTTPSIRGAKGADGVSISSIQQTTTSAADGGTNVVTVTLSNGQKSTFEVKNGSKGDNGSAPVKGVDYFTPEEVDEIKTEVNNNAETFIATELAKRGQTRPEFANSIEDCVDTTKLYVLPDGNIYAYMRKLVEQYTNQIPLSVDSDGKPFVGENGERGYISGKELATSNGNYNTVAGSETTGYIPVTKGDVIRFRDMPMLNNTNTHRICLYKADFSYIGGFTVQNSVNYGYLVGNQEYDSNNLVSISIVDKYNDKIAYIRFTSTDINPRSIITVNEEIIDGVYDYTWANTGHAFVPADYEDRIIAVEQASESHENRIKNLEMYGAESTSSAEIPAYIKAAADEVIEKVIAQQGSRSFTMIGLSDFHYSGVGDNKDNLIRACKAIAYIRGRINVDAIATLGDNIPHGESTEATLKSGHRWFKEINEILEITQQPGIIDFRTPGNHDRMGGNNSSGNPTEPMPDNAIYSYITGFNRQCEIGDVPGGWACKDFDGHKLRVIVLNTSEVEGKGRFSTYSGFHVSTAQYNWLIDTLNMNDKADAADWQILILSHHKADDYQAPATNASTNNYILPNILNAYNTGGSYAGVSAEDGKTISCNFAGKNAAKLIGQIHGHHHAYIYGLLKLGSNGTQTNVMAISTPTTGFGTGAGHNDDNDGNWYDSIKDTAEETAFCLYSIDLDNHVVNAIHYGNGIDRVIDY